MAIDLQKVLDEYRIEYRTSGVELSRGWLAFACPWCNDAKSHMGYSTNLGMFTCWRCGVKNEVTTLMKILSCSFDIAKSLIKKNFIPGTERAYDPKKKSKEVHLPKNYGGLKKDHKKYLKSRGFKPSELHSQWGLVGSSDDDMRKFGNRILIPIYHKGSLVSYHSRDITGRNITKAKPCPKEKEAVSHRNLLYGMDKVPGNTVIVSEGPFDVWRWGSGAVGTFGIKTTQHQMDLLRCFKNIFICFDGGEEEVDAQNQAERIADKLAVFQNVWVVDLGCDPADLSQKQANKVKQKFFKLAKEKDAK